MCVIVWQIAQHCSSNGASLDYYGKTAGMSPLKSAPSHRGSGFQSNTWLLGHMQICLRESISIGSFVVAGHVIRQCAVDDLVVEFVKIGGSCAIT